MTCAGGMSGSRRDGTGRFQAEHAAEYPQAAKDHTLGLAQKLITPVERRSQGLMARQRRPPSPGQQVEAIVEMGNELFDAECGGSRRR